MDNEDDEESDDDDNDGEVVEESNVADKLKNVVAIGNAKFHGFDEAQEWPGVKSCSWNEKRWRRWSRKPRLMIRSVRIYWRLQRGTY